MIIITTFAAVFHGIRFNVRRLFVVMTGNFFCACKKEAAPRVKRSAATWIQKFFNPTPMQYVTA